MNTKLGVKRLQLAALGGLISVILLGSPAAARGQDAGFSGRLWVGAVGRYVLNDNDPFTAPGFGTAMLKVSGTSVGFGADGEFRFNRWFGLDGAIDYSKMNVDFTTSNAPNTKYTQGFGAMPLSDIRLTHSVALNLAVRWQNGDADTNDPEHLTVDPTFVTIGFTRRP